MVRLLKALVPASVCVLLLPLKTTVPSPAVSVPLLVQFPATLRILALDIVSVRPDCIAKLLIVTLAALIVGLLVTPAVGITTSLIETGFLLVFQFVSVSQLVSVAPVQVIVVSIKVTVGPLTTGGPGSDVRTGVMLIAVTVPCVLTWAAAGGLLTVTEYLMVMLLFWGSVPMGTVTFSPD